MSTNQRRFAGVFAGSLFLFSGSASAQFIEISITVRSESHNRSGSASMVFDTRVPPIMQDNGGLFFPALAGTVITTRNNAVFSVAHPNPLAKDELDSSSGIYISDDYVGFGATKWHDLEIPPGSEIERGISVYFENWLGGETIPALHPLITSLPDEPGSYAFVEGDGLVISATVNRSHTTASYSGPRHPDNWGTIFYTARLTTSPEASPCSAADVNQDGVLDAWDVSLFTASYDRDRAIADVNGDGVVCFADIGDFITLYLDGCGE